MEDVLKRLAKLLQIDTREEEITRREDEVVSREANARQLWAEADKILNGGAKGELDQRAAKLEAAERAHATAVADFAAQKQALAQDKAAYAADVERHRAEVDKLAVDKAEFASLVGKYAKK